MWYFVVFQPSQCRNTHFEPQIWWIWPIFPNDSESLPKVCYINWKNWGPWVTVRQSATFPTPDVGVSLGWLVVPCSLARKIQICHKRLITHFSRLCQDEFPLTCKGLWDKGQLVFYRHVWRLHAPCAILLIRNYMNDRDLKWFFWDFQMITP